MFKESINIMFKKSINMMSMFLITGPKVADMPLFQNIPDFWNSESARVDTVQFRRCPFNVYRET